MIFKHLALFIILIFIAIHSKATGSHFVVEQHGFAGHYYSGDPTLQPVLVLGGSEGGMPTKLAQTIAQSGYPTLALACFKENALPSELNQIPLEYFTKAGIWLKKKHPKQQSITIVGWSKGAELSLLLASLDNTYNRVVAIAPSSVVWAGILNDWKKVPNSSWTKEGKDLAHVTFNPTGQVNGLLDLYSQSLQNRDDEGLATIAVENISGKVTLFSGGKDDIWPSSKMAESICQRMKETSDSHCIHHDHPDLGHLLDYKFLDPADALYRNFLTSIKN